MRLNGIDDEEMFAGYVLCSIGAPVPAATQFEAMLRVTDLLEHKPIMTAGYKCILHIHTATEECEITKIVAFIDPKTREKNTKVKYVKSGANIIARVKMERTTCVEAFDKVAQLGRFTMRDEGKTVAIGKVVKLPKA